MLAAETAVTLAAETAAHALVQVSCYLCSVNAAGAGAGQTRQKRICNAERARDVTGVGAGHYRADGHCSVTARPSTETLYAAEIFLARSALEGPCSYLGQAKAECRFPVDVAPQR